MSCNSHHGRPAEPEFLTPDQWTDLRRHYVRQAHAARQRAVEAAIRWTWRGLRRAAKAVVRVASYARTTPLDRRAWAAAPHGKANRI